MAKALARPFEPWLQSSFQIGDGLDGIEDENGWNELRKLLPESFGVPEVHLAWSGELETVPEDEVVFADAADHAHARRWTFRQSRKSTLQSGSTRALVVAEGLHPSADTDVRKLLDALEEELGHMLCKLSTEGGTGARSSGGPPF